PTDSGIDDTGIHAAVTLIREGDMGLKVSGLVMPALNGGCPTDSPIYEPICNSWLQAVDWPTPDSGLGSIELALHDLPAGAYALYSYHNHFGCYRGTPVHCDCICNVVPPMPVIKAMSAKQASELPHTGGSFGKLFPGYDPDALPEGIISIQDACNVQPQQVTTDAELVPSLIKFATDGSPVLVLYQGGCCEPDPVRADRDGGRGILNAFRLVSLEDAGMACCPYPGDGDGNVSPASTLSWQQGLNILLHDVYFGTDADPVGDANTSETLGVYMGRQGATEYDPAITLEFGQTYYWRIDEVNDANIPLHGLVWSFTVDDGKACCPSPDNGSGDIARDVTLSWSPGMAAASHDIYLGTSYNGVNDATTSSSQFKGNQALGNESYDPCDLLELGQTYYWRIDEVSPPYATSKGNVWSFTASECTMVDDMESYCNVGGCGNLIYDTWIDNYINFTGSLIALGLAPLPVHEGSQSMEFYYDNDWFLASYDYSETERAFSDPCDWDGLGAEVLTLYFYGHPGNDATSAEQMYAGLEDDTGPGSYVQVAYPNMGDIQVAEWQQWNLELSDFSNGGVDLGAVKKIYIGFGDRDDPVTGGSGTVYFDDIEICAYGCILPGPYADLSGDCVVDHKDLRILAEQWLDTGSISADLYPDSKVDGKDFAVLADGWLDDKLWP
ncbi:MAG: hypothetical protein ACYS21_13840, partial [Planctomycetota bacterium]